MSMNNKEKNRLVLGFTPLGWYLAITVIIPLFNQGFEKQKDQFFYHVITVFVVSMLLLAFFYLARICIVFLTRQIKKLF